MLTLLIRRKKYIIAVTVVIFCFYILLYVFLPTSTDDSKMSHEHHGHHDHGAMNAAAAATVTPDYSDHTGHLSNSPYELPAAADDIHAGHQALDSSSGHGSVHSMMYMAFHTNYNDLVVLFPFWKIETIWGLLISCLIIFLLGISYELLKVVRCELTCRCAKARLEKVNRAAVAARTGNANVGSRGDGPVGVSIPTSASGVGGGGGGDADNFQSKRAGTNGEHLLRDSERSSARLDGVGGNTGGDLHYSIRRSNAAVYRAYCCSSAHFVQTVLHVLQVFISFLLMLIFMTYNVWLCLAVLLGAGVGYYCFGWRVRALTDMFDAPIGGGGALKNSLAVNAQTEQICQDCH